MLYEISSHLKGRVYRVSLVTIRETLRMSRKKMQMNKII